MTGETGGGTDRSVLRGGGRDRRAHGFLRRDPAGILPEEAASATVDLARAHRLLRDAAGVLAAVAEVEGWPLPFSPLRFLVLAQLGEPATRGPSPVSLSSFLGVPPSSLAHHLEVLETADLIRRVPGRRHDGRKVMVRLTGQGHFAFWRLATALGRRVAG